MKCPICHRPTTFEGNPYRPFCSERCKLIDFGAWVNGEYAVPADEPAPPPAGTDEEGSLPDNEQGREP